MNISLQDLLDAGVHFGHQLRRWNPRSKSVIYKNMNGISIIDLEVTYNCLKTASEYIENLVASGKEILLVGTKKQAQDIVRETAKSVNMPFCANRWLGGCLTNFSTIKNSLEKYKKYIAMDTDGSMSKLANKKEEAVIRREMSRMHRNFEGLLNAKDLPAALFVVDIHKEAIAVNEARRMGIPIIGIVDTNSDPSLVQYPIPGNDDAVKSLRILIQAVGEAIQNGLDKRQAQKASQALPKDKARASYSHADIAAQNAETAI
jgi:small subunit ribosomal protein S2